MNSTACRTDLAGFCARLPKLLQPGVNGKPTVYVSRAPAIVDVMGGAAEEMGGLVLQGALDVAFAAAAAPRDDGKLVVVRLHSTGETTEKVLPLSVLNDAPPARSKSQAGDGRAPDDDAVRAIVSLLRVLSSHGAAPAFAGGLTIIIQSDWPTDAQLDLAGSLLVAVIEAVAEVAHCSLDAMQKAALCSAAATAIGAPSCNLRIPLAALVAEPRSLLLVRTQPHSTQNALELPDGVAILALEAELGRPVTPQRQRETCVAAAMGHTIIRELIRADGRAGESDRNQLANITPDEFVKRFRNRVPTRIKGRAFLNHFGELPNNPAAIEPDRLYKIRSRVEHFIYENRRVNDFVTTMARVRLTQDAAGLSDVGQLMFASHWSYSQRCGIGAVETDRLAGAVRTLGATQGFYGAKVTGFGAGGGMVVLMKDTPEAMALLTAQISQLQEKSGRRIRLYRGTATGASRFGAQPLEKVPIASA